MPIIAITPCKKPRDYDAAVRRAGATPKPLSLDDPAATALDGVDGLLLTGGDDVDPAIYGEPPHPTYDVSEPGRDAFEIDLVRRALDADLPVLAICRGLQVLNVAMGGTLIQHLPDISDRDEHREGVLHEVDLKPGSKVADAIGTNRPMCSSFHHQAIDRLAAGLVEAGWADDGTIEAVEVEGASWIIAVQWHPEDTAADDPSQQALFDALVRRSRS